MRNERGKLKRTAKGIIILQNEEGAVFERDWENAPQTRKGQYHKDFPKFVQKNQIGGFGTDPGSDGLFDGSHQKSDGAH